MSGNMWELDNVGTLHPEENALLAYVRQQLSPDDAYEIYQHLALCETCSLQHAHLLLQSDLAYSMPAYPSIVDMLGTHIDSPAAAQLALRQRRQAKLQQDVTLGFVFVTFFLSKALGIQRQSTKKPARTAIALRSVPLVGIVVLIFSVLLIMAIVLAYTLTNHMYIPGGSSSGSRAVAPAMTAPVALQPKPTPQLTPPRVVMTPGPGTTVGVAPTVTGAPPGTAKPVVQVCTTNAEQLLSQLQICGYNFKPGDRIVLYEVIPGNVTRPRPPVIADAHGSFSEVWMIPNCHLVPSYIFAQDPTRHFETAWVPVNFPIGPCHP